MIQIEKIEIKYFRSIYSVEIKGLSDLSVFSGKNDCGKSNILRALNLFFNNKSGWNEPFNFNKDFCRKRLIECQGTSHSKQFIRVTVHFKRGNRSISLPEKFWVSRTWTRNSATPDEKNSLKKENIHAQSLDRALASLQKYLGTITFEYVPAVKDRSFFNYSLGILQEAILQSRESMSLTKVISDFNETVKNEADTLHEEFKQASNVDISIQLPDNLEELFRAFSVSTGKSDNFPLNVRGDGIQARFLPSLLHHVAMKSKRYFIWGFEEPENCLEHGLASMLADDMQTRYSKESQILVTSHSPAFLCFEKDNVSAFRVYSKEESTEVTTIKADNPDINLDLGLLELQKQYQSKYIEEIGSLKQANDILGNSINSSNMPILLVEGKNDVTILNEAWKRLRLNEKMPFKIISCDVSGADEDGGGAGCGILAKAVESCRLDMPKLIGLFDYDTEGLKAFKLDKNFCNSDFSADVKISSNKHVAAIVLPEINGKEEYRKIDNLVIEFLFPDQCITTKINGKGLMLEPGTIVKKTSSGKEIGKEVVNELHFRKIIGGKTYFASSVVPTFKDNDFASFDKVFNLIKTTLDKLG